MKLYSLVTRLFGDFITCIANLLRVAFVAVNHHAASYTQLHVALKNTKSNFVTTHFTC